MIWCMWERMHAPHTTLHQGQFFCDVLFCSVKFHTTLHQFDMLMCFNQLLIQCLWPLWMNKMCRSEGFFEVETHNDPYPHGLSTTLKTLEVTHVTPSFMQPLHELRIFEHVGVSVNGESLKWMVYSGKSFLNLNGWSRSNPFLGNLHMVHMNLIKSFCSHCPCSSNLGLNTGINRLGFTENL